MEMRRKVQSSCLSVVSKLKENQGMFKRRKLVEIYDSKGI